RRNRPVEVQPAPDSSASGHIAADRHLPNSAPGEATAGDAVERTQESRVAGPLARVLLLTADAREQASAIEACRHVRLSFDLLPEFPGPEFDYSAFFLVVVGTNMMDHWGAPERKAPAAFQ